MNVGYELINIMVWRSSRMSCEINLGQTVGQRTSRPWRKNEILRCGSDSDAIVITKNSNLPVVCTPNRRRVRHTVLCQLFSPYTFKMCNLNSLLHYICHSWSYVLCTVKLPPSKWLLAMMLRISVHLRDKFIIIIVEHAQAHVSHVCAVPDAAAHCLHLPIVLCINFMIEMSLIHIFTRAHRHRAHTHKTMI